MTKSETATMLRKIADFVHEEGSDSHKDPTPYNLASQIIRCLAMAVEAKDG